MPSSPLAALAAQLATATDPHAALQIVNAELAQSERGAGFGLLRFDARRQTLSPITPHVDAPLGASHGVSQAGSQAARPAAATLALDHLPPTVQYAVLAGQRFAEVGDQGAQYAEILGLEPAGLDLRLSLKGIVVDGALAAVLAVYDTRRRGNNKLMERAEPLAALFELAFGRLSEREARFEAVAALHDITSRLRAEHASVTAALEREVERLRAAQRAGTSDVVRGLRDAVAAAEQRAGAAEERLGAVEHQVVSAVERLDRAHQQLHDQAQQLREREQTIRLLEQRVAAAASPLDA
jgi:hypothetical protein